MSASTAIGMVSTSLRNLLLGEMVLVPAVPVTVLAPDEPGGDRRINLFLYKVMENNELKNLDWQIKGDGTNQLVPPPLSLNLYYLMTPYAPNHEQTGNSTAHEILGDAMRVFYENAIIPDAYLEAGLQSSREQVKIMQIDFNMEELAQIWNTSGNKPFRLSVMYEVAVVQLDMLSDKERPLPQRVRQIGVPDVRAPYQPPVVDSINPISGPTETTVTFHGSNLEGWRAYATILRQPVLEGLDLTGDSFTMDIPAGLAAGFYEIRVDISHLYRRVFFFEVTA